MKNIFILLLLIPAFCLGENPRCNEVREGVFKMHGLYGSLHTIIRTDEKQIEYWGSSATVFEYDIRWISDCIYLLFNPIVVKGFDSLLAMNCSDTLINEITEVNPYWHTITSYVRDCEPKTELTYFSVDTTNKYKDLSALEIFKDFKGRFSAGTFVGYNYIISCKQHSFDSSNYVLAFLEGLVINEKSKFKILDDVYCKIDSTEKITTYNCRFNNKYDKEIVAIYCSTNKKEEAQIIRAWRFNKIKLKIEEVPVELVKFREADKFLTIWNENTFEELKFEE